MIDTLIAAVVGNIKSLQGAGPLGYRIPAVEPYDGQVNEDQMPQLLARTPAVFVAAGAARASRERDRWRWDVGLTLLVVTRDLASGAVGAALRVGPAGGPGAYLIAEQLAAAFSGIRLGLEIAAIEPREIRTLVPGWARGTKAALVGVELVTAFWGQPVNGAGLDDFLRVQSRLAIGEDFTPYTDLSQTRSQDNG